MKPYHFVHLVMLALDEEIRGKTRLQKTMYFLGLLTNRLPELGYRPHYYGPYSDAVAEGVNTLISLGFVARDSQGFGTVNDRGFEVTRHDFRLTEEGRMIARQKAEQNKDVWEAIQAAVAKFRTALTKSGNPDYMKLSIAAKSFHLLKERPNLATPAELSDAAKQLGWNPTPEEIAASKTLLSELGLTQAA